MKKYILIPILLFFVTSCCEENLSPVDSAVSKACSKCNQSKTEMTWLRTLIKASENEGSKRGDFYAITRDEKSTVIIQQPLIMSCIACIQYDCQGNLLPEEERITMPFSELKNSTLIYKTKNE